MQFFAAWGLIEWAVASLAIGGGAVVVKSVTGDVERLQKSAGAFVKEVVIPGAIIYGAFIYLSTRKKS
jgi:hypothetical protein